MSRSRNRQRDVLNPYSQPSLDTLLTFKMRPAPVLLPVPSNPPPALVLDAGDRRLWRPDRTTRPPHAAKPGASRVVASYKSLNALRFADPKYVALCLRRQQRKQVLFAKRLTRKGAGATRRRRNFWSAISC